MNPIYKFTITIGETETQVYPNYKDDIAKEYELETGQRFFRSKLSGKITFQKDDYDLLDSQAFETEFIFKVYKSDDLGETWFEYWTGKFMKTDCSWDDDDKKAIVTPDVLDEYNDVLAGLEKEYNLIKLAPAKTPVEIKKRPLIQLYIPGDSVVSCFLSGNYWEQDTAFDVSNESTLVNTYYFAKASTLHKIFVSGTGTPAECAGDYVAEGDTPTTFIGRNILDITGEEIYKTTFDSLGTALLNAVSHGKSSSDIGSIWQDANLNYWQLMAIPETYQLEFIKYFHTNSMPYDEFGTNTLTHVRGATNTSTITYNSITSLSTSHLYAIRKTSDETIMFASKNAYDTLTDGNITFIADNGTGTLDGYKTTIPVYMRYLLDVETISGLNTYEIPADDIVENNRNYSRAIGYAIDQVTITPNVREAATEYGVTDDGYYFDEPYSIYGHRYFPVARSTWGLSSIWFNFYISDEMLETDGRKSYIMKDSVLLSDAIKVLLNEIAPDISHDGTSEYSEFLYGTNPITYGQFKLLITQKSNILAGEYDRPAQKAPITLTQILSMLRDCFRCFWYIEDGKFKIEHIKWFRNGGSYSSGQLVSYDLTLYENIRNGKKWGYKSSAYDFDKIDMPERYQFEWMDEVTQSFDGFPIQVVSKYVTAGKIESISISNFTTDIDYMLLNPGAINEDGFALMAGVFDNLFKYGLFATGYVQGYYGNNGITFVSSSTFWTTDFIQVVPGVSYYRQNGNSSYYVYAYDSNQNPVVVNGSNVFWHSNFESNPIPDGVAFIRAIFPPANLSTFAFSSTIMNLPFVSRTIDGIDMTLQNGIMSWVYLHPNFYVYDLPAYNVEINDQTAYANSVDRKKKQTVEFPTVDDIDPLKLIKTNLGTGAVDKISVNLHSRLNKVTLKYDTE